jgi:hypothetical protein
MVDQFRNPTFTLADADGGFTITTRDGYLYHVDHSRVSVAFQHKMKATAVSGGPPVMEMLSTALPFTELLSEVSSRLIAAARLLPNLAERKIFQVGIVSTTRVAFEDVPPGIARFIAYQNRPWGKNSIDSFSMEVTSEVDSTQDWNDRCQHKLVRPEDRKELMSLNFDFQRRFKSGQAVSEAQMKTLLNKCGEGALKYFETIAEGDLFDEHIISKAD